MMTKVEPDRCRDSVRQIIPWYVNDTLSGAEAALVREHIESCAECRADVELHSGMRDGVLGNDITPMMPKSSAADIIDTNEDVGLLPDAATPSIFPNRFAVAAALAVMAVAIVALLDMDRRADNTNQIFETATSPDIGTNIDYVLQLRFQGGITEQQRDDIVLQLKTAVKWSAMSNGDYEVHVQFAKPSLAALEQYEKRVESIAGVQSANFTALQLPMR